MIFAVDTLHDSPIAIVGDRVVDHLDGQIEISSGNRGSHPSDWRAPKSAVLIRTRLEAAYLGHESLPGFAGG